MVQKSGKGAIIVLIETFVRIELRFRVAIYFGKTKKCVQ